MWPSRAVTARKCTKKRDARAKLLFCLIKPLLFLLSLRRCILNFLLFTIHCDPSKTEYLGENAPTDSTPNVFSTHWSVPSFLVRKVENRKKFPLDAQAW